MEIFWVFSCIDFDEERIAEDLRYSQKCTSPPQSPRVKLWGQGEPAKTH